MKILGYEMDVETYVLCEKAALAAGKKSVADWISFLISERVGHTFI